MKKLRAPKPMIDRYRWYEVVGIYFGIALFLAFVLAPFIEGFLVSLKPLSRLFSTPYNFWPVRGSYASRPSRAFRSDITSLSCRT